ncbi:glycosyltransferase family 39 protein [Kitasatospora cheerisanensis]|uniref:glycosyltransferase family 39 protein n=1 Tax=Kitasatospora cheerisanensis TaxID=81942 RepID=UPI00142FB27D|nr:glycosyltransferase family 39 protein [Kitasatospora cheerisanensis]
MKSASAEAAPPVTEVAEPARAQGLFRRAWGWSLRLVWLWPGLLTLAVGVFGSGRPFMWRDELATWSVAHRSVPEIMDVLHHLDAVIGPYYLFMHFWTELFGDSLTSLRLPSALAMAGAAVFVTLTGRKVFGPATGLMAGLLFAFTPSVSRYGQEARGYAFVVLAIAAATFFLLRALERPTVLRWLPYSLSLFAAGLFHLISLVVVAGHAVVVLMRWWRPRNHRLLIGFALSVVLGALPLTPLAMVGQTQVGRQLGWLDAPSLQYVAAGFWPGLFHSYWFGLCVIALALLPLAWAKGRRVVVELAMVAVVPIVLVWLISQSGTAYFIDRYLLFTLTAWSVLAAAGLSRLRPKPVAAIGLAVVVLLGVPDQRSVRQKYSRETWDGVAASKVIAEHYRPGDGLVTLGGDYRFFQLDVVLDYTLPEDVKLKGVFFKKDRVANGDIYPALCSDQELKACIGDTQRVWAITVGPPGYVFNQYSAAEKAVLNEVFPKQTNYVVRDMNVTLLERGPATG